MRFLVTGGAGFIGSHIVQEILTQRLAEPTGPLNVLDDLSTGKLSSLAPFGDRVQLIRGDIRDRSALHKALSGVDTVIHLAAMTSVAGSIANPKECHEVNAQGTLELLRAAHQAGVTKLILASSAAVYGDNPVSPKNESLRPEPMSPYASSKLEGERHLKEFAELHGMQTVSLRFFNVFGPRQDPKSQYAAAIPRFIHAALAGQAPRVFGDGEQTRDFIYAQDVARASLLAARQSLPGGSVFNVATGRATSINQLLKHLGRILGKDLAPIYQAAAPGDIKHSLADVSRIERALGFKPSISIEEGLRETIARLNGSDP